MAHIYFSTCWDKEVCFIWRWLSFNAIFSLISKHDIWQVGKWNIWPFKPMWLMWCLSKTSQSFEMFYSLVPHHHLFMKEQPNNPIAWAFDHCSFLTHNICLRNSSFKNENSVIFDSLSCRSKLNGFHSVLKYNKIYFEKCFSCFGPYYYTKSVIPLSKQFKQTESLCPLKSVEQSSCLFPSLCPFRVLHWFESG